MVFGSGQGATDKRSDSDRNYSSSNAIINHCYSMVTINDYTEWSRIAVAIIQQTPPLMMMTMMRVMMINGKGDGNNDEGDGNNDEGDGNNDEGDGQQ